LAPAFHLSLSVSDLERTRRFYVDVLDARVGRVTEQWIDLWLFGAQVTIYARPTAVVPPPFRDAQHFGATLDLQAWQTLANRLSATGATFRLAPIVDGVRGVAKMMLADPDGYLIEIKAYADPSILQRPET
jgi:hypothetical protein